MPHPSRQYSDNDLRESRLVFYKEDIQQIDSTLREFLSRSKSQAALLVDKDGHLITQEGSADMTETDVDTISALVAGCVAATREMARILGEEEFSVLFHQGKTDSIQLSLVGDRTLLTVIFDEATTVGMVRLYASETARRLSDLFAKHERERRQNPGARNDPDLAEGFVGDAKDKLDDLFGG